MANKIQAPLQVSRPQMEAEMTQTHNVDGCRRTGELIFIIFHRTLYWYYEDVIDIIQM